MLIFQDTGVGIFRRGRTCWKRNIFCCDGCGWSWVALVRIIVYRHCECLMWSSRRWPLWWSFCHPPLWSLSSRRLAFSPRSSVLLLVIEHLHLRFRASRGASIFLCCPRHQGKGRGPGKEREFLDTYFDRTCDIWSWFRLVLCGIKLMGIQHCGLKNQGPKG